MVASPTPPLPATPRAELASFLPKKRFRVATRCCGFHTMRAASAGPQRSQPARRPSSAQLSMDGRLPSSAAARLGRPAINQKSRSIEEILLQRTAAAAMASLDAQAQARGRPAGQKTQLLQFSQLSQLTQMTDLAQSLQRATSAPGLRVATPQRPFSAAATLGRNQLADSLRAGDALDVRAPAQRPATSTARRTMAAAHSATPEHRARPQQAGHPPAGPASSTDGRWPQPAARESSQAALLPRSALRRSLTAGRYVDPGREGGEARAAARLLAEEVRLRARLNPS